MTIHPYFILPEVGQSYLDYIPRDVFTILVPLLDAKGYESARMASQRMKIRVEEIMTPEIILLTNRKIRAKYIHKAIVRSPLSALRVQELFDDEVAIIRENNLALYNIPIRQKHVQEGKVRLSQQTYEHKKRLNLLLFCEEKGQLALEDPNLSFSCVKKFEGFNSQSSYSYSPHKNEIQNSDGSKYFRHRLMHEAKVCYIHKGSRSYRLNDGLSLTLSKDKTQLEFSKSRKVVATISPPGYKINDFVLLSANEIVVASDLGVHFMKFDGTIIHSFPFIFDRIALNKFQDKLYGLEEQKSLYRITTMDFINVDAPSDSVVCKSPPESARDKISWFWDKFKTVFKSALELSKSKLDDPLLRKIIKYSAIFLGVSCVLAAIAITVAFVALPPIAIVGSFAAIITLSMVALVGTALFVSYGLIAVPVSINFCTRSKKGLMKLFKHGVFQQ